MDAPNLNLPEYYINRELSQLAFNFRVLEQARDRSVPLLERLKFLCISSTNLDEFFEIRVAGLKHRLAVGSAPAGPDNLGAAELLKIKPTTLNEMIKRYEIGTRRKRTPTGQESDAASPSRSRPFPAAELTRE